MAKIYYRKMVRGDGYKITQVPEQWRTQVVELLHENGYEIASDGTAYKVED